MKSGFQILPEFRIVQHKRDIKLLHEIKKYFKSGVVRINHEDRYELRIRNINSLNRIIIPFFDKYPLHTQKKYDFLKFKKILKIIEKKEHLTRKGVNKIYAIASKMNRQNKKITKDNLDKDKVRSL